MFHLLKTYFRYYFAIKRDGKQPTDIHLLPGKQLLQLDDFRKMHPWQTDDKPYHPDNHEEWVDKRLPYQLEDGTIHLPIKYNPRSFTDDKGKTFTTPVARSVLFSKQPFTHGYFEAELMLPREHGRWDAFWLTGQHTWPPEVDVLESYSREDYYNNFRRLQSNVHHNRPDGSKTMLGAKNHPIPRAMANRFIRFGLLWQPKNLSVFYNGYLVRHIQNKKILEQFNQPMHLIISSGVQYKYYNPYPGDTPIENRTLKVRNISYTPLPHD